MNDVVGQTLTPEADRRKKTPGLVVKRIVDCVIAAAGLILLAPAMLLISVAIWMTMGRPIIFRQVRPGLHGVLFTLYKFRTMKELCAADGTPLPDTERLTVIGSILRASSLDELPELVNVLKGEMSLIGPRPLLPEFLDRYTAEQARRHDVRPGVTGLAQVNGRNAIPFSKRLELDLRYVNNWSLWLDLRILAATVPKVLGLHGVESGQSLDDFDDIGLCAESTAGRNRSGASTAGDN